MVVVSLRKRPLRIRRLSNVCDLSRKLPYWWRQSRPESGRTLWLVERNLFNLICKSILAERADVISRLSWVFFTSALTSTIYSLCGTSTDRKSNISLTDIVFIQRSNLRKGSHIMLDTIIYKGARFNNQSILDVRTHFKANLNLSLWHITSLAAHQESKHRRPKLGVRFIRLCARVWRQTQKSLETAPETPRTLKNTGTMR